jgi:predicted nuclease of predicted toxin-antitoxin system
MRLLLDENLEHEVYHRLVNFGHDVIHVEVSDGLAKGLSDPDIAAVSLDESRVIVTYDDDFRTDFDTTDYHASCWSVIRNFRPGRSPTSFTRSHGTTTPTT